MGRQRLQPETFGRHATTWPEQMFRIRIKNESDPERLQQALKAEREKQHPRDKRIELITEQLDMDANQNFAMTVAALTEEAFKRRVYQCDDREKLVAAIEHEIDRQGETRRERIGLLNERKETLK